MALSKVDLANMVENVAPPSTIPDVNFRNIIINGDMSIAQRSTSASSVSTQQYPAIDRFQFGLAGTVGAWTISQSTTVPSGQGFSKSFKMECTTADASLAAGDHIRIAQIIEGQNLQYLKKGTSSAESLTLSFWVRSNKTGTYICELYDNDNTRQISKSYTISAADTWEKKTLTFAGDTTGAFGNDNAASLYCNFFVAAGTDYTSGTLNTSWNSVTAANRAVGQVNLADSTSNEWYITGIQLEAGTAASDFEFLPVDVNRLRCHRYYQHIASGSADECVSTGVYYTSSLLQTVIQFPNTMRSTPSIDIVSGTNYYVSYRDGGNDYVNAFTLDGSSHSKVVTIINNTEASGTAGQASLIRTANTSAYLAFDSEL